MLSGNEALSRALGASRLRVTHGFVGVPLHRFVDGVGARPPVGLQHRAASSDLSAAGLALGGALLGGPGASLLLRAGGVNVALEALATLGILNELRAPVVVVTGYDAGPVSAATAQDDRGTLAHVCHLPQLDPGSPDELYHMTRLAAAASRAAHLPVVVRVSSRVLDGNGDVHEQPADPVDGARLSYARTAGPYVLSSATYRYHVDKRARRLHQLEALASALVTRTGTEGAAGVVLAGHLGPRAQARVHARRVPSLRLGAAWPLPRRVLEAFMRDKREVLVIEEGEAFLERELQNIAHHAGLACRVRGLEEFRRPVRLDDDRLETALRRLGAAVDETRAHERDATAWRAAGEALAGLRTLDMEPWPLFLARARAKMWGFAQADPRARLLGAVRGLGRPTLVVADPSAVALLGFRERLIDVKAGFGLAPSIAGALSDASEVEEQTGTPLAVALMGDLNFFQGSLLGIIDNVTHRRDVLHVILVRELDGTTPGLAATGATQAALVEGQLRGIGIPYLTARLGDADVENNLRAIAEESGPRALVCFGAPGREEAIGG